MTGWPLCAESLYVIFELKSEASIELLKSSIFIKSVVALRELLVLKRVVRVSAKAGILFGFWPIWGGCRCRATNGSSCTGMATPVKNQKDRGRRTTRRKKSIIE